MRILGGEAKGRAIRIKKSYLSEGLRPTSQKVRKAIFDILQDRILEASFLDLFSGTGAVGIEAISRGAKRAVFVEISKNFISNMKNNSNLFNIKDKIHIIKEDVSCFLKKNDESFDIIFADPPYEYDKYPNLIQTISDREMLNKGGLLIIEHSSRLNMLQSANYLTLKKSYKYGDTTLSILW